MRKRRRRRGKEEGEEEAEAEGEEGEEGEGEKVCLVRSSPVSILPIQMKSNEFYTILNISSYEKEEED